VTDSKKPSQNGSREKRVGVVGIVIENRLKTAPKVNQILSAYGHIIVGRMGIPYKDRGICVISLIVDGDTDTLGAMTGKLGSIPELKSKLRLRFSMRSQDVGWLMNAELLSMNIVNFWKKLI